MIKDINKPPGISLGLFLFVLFYPFAVLYFPKCSFFIPHRGAVEMHEKCENTGAKKKWR